jgi:plastocyanin
MSRNQRLVLAVAALVVVVVAFIVVNPGGGGGSTTSGSTVQRIALAGHDVKGGPQTIKVKKGDKVHIVVTADARNTVHLHGYDIEKQAAPGKPAEFRFTADQEGVFDIESHTFENAGFEPSIGKLVVEPS